MRGARFLDNPSGLFLIIINVIFIIPLTFNAKKIMQPNFLFYII